MKEQGRNKNSILDFSKSRFTPEERARMHENAGAAAADGGGVFASESFGVGAEKNKKDVSGENFSERAGREHGGISAKKAARVKAERKRNTVHEAAENSRNDNMQLSVRERRRQTKRENIIIMTALFLAAVVVCGVLCVTVLFKTEKILVADNGGAYSDDDVIKSSGIKLGDNMFLIGSAQAEKNIVTRLPYIEKAEIKKKCSGTVEIKLRYTFPAMAVVFGSGYVYLSPSGKVLEVNAGAVPKTTALVTGLPVKTAEPGKTVVFNDEKSMGMLLELAKALDENGITGVSAYNFETPSDVRVTVNNLIELRLGPSCAAAEKLRFGREVIKKEAELNPGKHITVNLRDKNRAYVKDERKEEETAVISTRKNIAAGETFTSETETFSAVG